MIQEITCEYIASARPVDRATVAEMLYRSRHRAMKCEKCGKFHVWVEVSALEWTGAAAARDRIHEDFYVQVGSNAYLHKGYRKTKKEKSRSSEDEDH